MKNSSTKIKIFSFSMLWLFTVLSGVATYFAVRVSTDYNMEQFLPKRHTLITADRESKKVFHINEASPHILLLSLGGSDSGHWYDSQHLNKLQKLTQEISAIKTVKSVISLGNIQSAFENKNELLVAALPDLQKQGFKAENILHDPLYTPNLISKDGRSTALFVMPGHITLEQHKNLLHQLERLSKRSFPQTRIQVGGPAAIRTEFIGLLSHEITLFVLLALLCAVVVLKIMFRGYWVLAHVLYILIVSNTLALATMSLLHISFNVLTSTVPIIITVSSLGICAHLLVRMGEAAHLSFLERVKFLKELVREITITIFTTAFSTSVGFACLIPSDVPLISDYGLAVALGVLASSTATLILLPSLYLWVKWPIPRPILNEPKRFAYFLVRRSKLIVPAMAVFTLAIGMAGTRLSWTARLFDDLPAGQPSRSSTEMISRKLGGVATLDFIVGSEKLSEPWKHPANLKKLNDFAVEMRRHRQVGSVLTVADFMLTGANKDILPKSKAAVAELQFLYAMSGESPLQQFLSANERWTRVAVRLPDLPADQNQRLIAAIRGDLEKRFSGMQVKTAGMAAVIPLVNRELSRDLMWGFFEALFWIVLMLAVVFRSLRWALIGIIPNLVPPAILLGFLALFQVPIKPGIAIIFSISLGIAFDNTIYILGRLQHMLKSHPRRKRLPIYTLMKRETMPCLVSALCLFAGFSIFVFSMFPVNKMFGLFTVLSIAAGLLGDLVWLPAILHRFPSLLLEPSPRATIKKFRLRPQEYAVKLSPYLILAALGMIAFHNSYAAGAEKKTVQSILKAIEEKGAPPSERVDIQMLIQEPDGSKKQRELSILRKNGSEARALVRLNKPSDLKGLSLLTVVSHGKEDQWLYLPSDKKSRRILGSNKKGKFLDSEISYEDLSLSTYKAFNNKIVKDDGKLVQIESVAKPGSESSYGRITTWISSPDYRVERVEYHDKAGKLFKRADFKGYTKVGDKYWRARQVHVVNVQTQRKTSMVVKAISIKKIDDDEVSLAALED